MSAGEQAPGFGIVEATWEKIDNQTDTVGNSGASDPLEIGDPLWRGEIAVNLKDRAQFDLWGAFFSRRKLRTYSFIMPRTFRRKPRDASIASDVGLVLTSIDVAGSALVLSGWGAGKAAHYGDMISYRTANGGYYIGEIQAEATADSAGAISVEVWPRPRAMHATQAARDPRRIDALGEFKLLDRPDIREKRADWSIKFDFEQVLR